MLYPHYPHFKIYINNYSERLYIIFFRLSNSIVSFKIYPVQTLQLLIRQSKKKVETYIYIGSTYFFSQQL